MQKLTPMRTEIEGVRATILENMPWSPSDYIRTLSAAGDKALFTGQLTHTLPEQDDLRYIYRGGEDQDVALFADRLPWDSQFMGYDVARLRAVFPLTAPYYRPHADFRPALQALTDEARRRGVKYLFATVDARDLATLDALGKLGFSVIETRAFYHMPLKDYEYPERYAVRAAVSDDVPYLGRAAQESINLYDRFHADPFITAEEADRMMYRWVEASVTEGFADITIVPDAPRPLAFCTVKYHSDKWEAWGLKLAQPVFSAVAPEFKGWYKKIISEINYYLKDMGVEHSYLCTQVTNKAVVWVWESLGYRFGKSELVLRVIL